MRLPIATLAAVTALAACEVPEQTTRDAMSCSAPQSVGAYGAPDMDAQIMCMSEVWAESRRALAEAKAEAAVERRPLPPEVIAEVDEVLSRDVGGDTDDVRLAQLRDAVSDARRLAEIVAAG